jgi:hypothetical protein
MHRYQPGGLCASVSVYVYVYVYVGGCFCLLPSTHVFIHYHTIRVSYLRLYSAFSIDPVNNIPHPSRLHDTRV